MSWLALTYFGFDRHGAIRAWPGIAYFVVEWMLPSVAYGLIVRHPAALLATAIWPLALLVPERCEVDRGGFDFVALCISLGSDQIPVLIAMTASLVATGAVIGQLSKAALRRTASFA